MNNYFQTIGHFSGVIYSEIIILIVCNDIYILQNQRVSCLFYIVIY